MARSITLEYRPDFIVRIFILELLQKAEALGLKAQMMRHLVGALLHLLFPATVDDPTLREEGREISLGDFLVGDTAVQVVQIPVLDMYEKSKEILALGYQVLLLVEDKYFCGTRQNAEILLPGKIMVNSIESFVCQSIESLAGYTKAKTAQVIRKLVEEYNQRVQRLESDPSLLITVSEIQGIKTDRP